MSTTPPESTKGITTQTVQPPPKTVPDPKMAGDKDPARIGSDAPLGPETTEPEMFTTEDSTAYQISAADLDRLTDQVMSRLAQRNLSHNQTGFVSTGGPTHVVSSSGGAWFQCPQCGEWSGPGVTHACASGAIVAQPVTEPPVSGEAAPLAPPVV